MNAIKKARHLIAAKPQSDTAVALTRLVRALESDESFQLAELYALEYDDFNLALEVLREWRLDRYYMGKVKLLDLAAQLHDVN